MNKNCHLKPNLIRKSLLKQLPNHSFRIYFLSLVCLRVNANNFWTSQHIYKIHVLFCISAKVTSAILALHWSNGRMENGRWKMENGRWMMDDWGWNGLAHEVKDHRRSAHPDHHPSRHCNRTTNNVPGIDEWSVEWGVRASEGRALSIYGEFSDFHWTNDLYSRSPYSRIHSPESHINQHRKPG